MSKWRIVLVIAAHAILVVLVAYELIDKFS